MTDDLGTQLYELIEEARARLLSRTSETDQRLHELETEMTLAANHTTRSLKNMIAKFEHQQNDLRFLAEKLVARMTLQIPDYTQEPQQLPSEQYAEQITQELH